MRRPPLALLCIPLTLAACAGGPSPRADCGAEGFHLTAMPRVRYGPVAGSLQTGRGGQPGTSSPDRPKLREVGVRTAEEAGVGLVGAWSANEISLDVSRIWLRGDDTLGSELVSQGTTFPAGAAVTSRTSVDLARLGWRRRFDVSLGGGDTLEVRPGIGADSFRFDYRLTGPDGRVASRSYGHVAPDLELGLAWRPGGDDPWRFSLRASQSLPFLLPKSNRLNLLEADIAVRYALDPTWSVELSVGARHVEFEDAQTLPNHPDLRFGPFVGLALAVTF